MERDTDTPRNEFPTACKGTDIAGDHCQDRRRSMYIFRNSWQEWASNTSCHGIKFVFDGKSSVIRRVLWLITFGGLVYYLVSMSLTQTLRYLEYKTATKITKTLEKTISFPAVTICNLNLIKNDSVTDPKTRTLLKEMYMKALNVTVIEDLGEDFLSNVSLKQLFANGTPSIEETFLYCQWLTDFLNCHEILVPKETDFGHCYTFGSKNSNRTYTVQNAGYQHGVTDGVTFTIWLNQDNYFIGDTSSAGIKLIIHDPYEEPDYRFGLSFSPGHSYFVSLRKEMKTFLPYPVKAFGSIECTNTKSQHFKNPLKFSDHYSLFACMNECKYKYIRNTCGCATVYDIGDLRECTPFDHINCTYKALRSFSTTFDTNSCNCPLPCSSTVYNPTVSSAYFPNYNFLKILLGNNSEHNHLSRDNLVQVRIFFETLMTKHEDQILEFTWEDLIASYGGFMGLAVGASAITILEFFEMFIFCLYRCLQVRREDKKT